MKIHFDHVLYMLLLVIYRGKLLTIQGKLLSNQAWNRRLYLFDQLMVDVCQVLTNILSLNNPVPPRPKYVVYVCCDISQS